MAPTLHTICEHEAAHAVMRWLRGLPARRISISDNGGYSDGTSRRIRSEDALLVTLAGYAWDFRLDLNAIDIHHSDGDDLDSAHECLKNILRVPELESEDECLIRNFEWARDLLWDYSDLVEKISDRLFYDGYLSARTVARIIQQWAKRHRPAQREKSKGRES